MKNLYERLDKLKKLIQDRDFLEGNGLSNEINIRFFCYDPAEEMIVRHFIELIKNDKFMSCRLVEQNLYKIFLSICEKKGIMETIENFEENKGSEKTLATLQYSIGQNDFIEEMKKETYEKGDVLMLTGIGSVFPFMRIHTLLTAMQNDFSDIPILVFYPGEFDGKSLKLFNILSPNNYYRAFNII